MEYDNNELIKRIFNILPSNLIELSNKLISNDIEDSLMNLHSSVIQFISDLITEHKSPSLVSSSSLSHANELNDMLIICEVIIDKSWERLNCGHWSDVPKEWRYLYGFNSLMKCLLIIKMNENRDALLKALKTLDYGLLMTPQIGDNLLPKIASLINKRIVLMDNDEPNNDKSEELLNNTRVKKRKINNTDDSICRVKCIDIQTFYTEFFVPKIPVIIEDAMTFWPAMSGHRWTYDYLLNIAAHRTVPIEIGSKYTDEEWSQKLMTLKEFINGYVLSEKSSPIGYLAQHNLFDHIEELRNDFSIPDYCCISRDYDCDNDSDVDINAWFGPSGTVSPLHYDPKDNLLSQVMGTKYVRLYSDSTPIECLYVNDCELLSNTSRVDIENVDTKEFPLFNTAKFVECHLRESEMLFIPKGFWHFVKSESPSFSISFWWK